MISDSFFSKFHKNKKKTREDKAHEHKTKRLARFEAAAPSSNTDAAPAAAASGPAAAAAAGAVGLGAGVKGRGDGLGNNKVCAETYRATSAVKCVA